MLAGALAIARGKGGLLWIINRFDRLKLTAELATGLHLYG
jgi:hypothetical protein